MTALIKIEVQGTPHEVREAIKDLVAPATHVTMDRA